MPAIPEQVQKVSGRRRKQPKDDSKLQTPRSHGDVLAVIRMELGVSQKAMRQRLDLVPSEFLLKAAGKRPAAQLTRWEMGKDNTPFGALHRYGTASGTRTGIMQVISLIFANWRDAADISKGQEYVDQKYRDNESLEKGLRALADYIHERNPQPGKTSPARHKEAVSAKETNYNLIRDLLAAYRKGAGTNMSLPDARVEQD